MDELELIKNAEWHIKFRMPSGVNIAKTKNGKPFTIYRNAHLNKRIKQANIFVTNFRYNFDLAIIYAKEPKTLRDLGEIARFDKASKKFIFSVPL